MASWLKDMLILKYLMSTFGDEVQKNKKEVKKMVELTKENFEEEVLNSDGVVMVDYWSENCDLCLELMPDVEKLAEEYADDVKFAKLNIVGNRRLAIGQKVLGLPAILIYEDGEKKAHLSGDELEIEDIREKLEEIV